MCNMLENKSMKSIQIKGHKKNFVSGIETTCLKPNLIYLITCKVCGKQGVESTEYLPARISNYYSHIKKKEKNEQNFNTFSKNIKIIEQKI